MLFWILRRELAVAFTPSAELALLIHPGLGRETVGYWDELQQSVSVDNALSLVVVFCFFCATWLRLHRRLA